MTQSGHSAKAIWKAEGQITVKSNHCLALPSTRGCRPVATV